MASSGERIYIGTHLALITEHNESGPGSYILGVEFDGVTGMTGNEDRDWPVLDPAFGLAKRLGCEGIWFKHQDGVEFVTQSAESAPLAATVSPPDASPTGIATAASGSAAGGCVVSACRSAGDSGIAKGGAAPLNASNARATAAGVG